MGLKALLNDTHRLTPIIKDWSDTCIRVRSFIIFPADSDEVPIAARRHYSNVYWPNAYIGLSRVLVAVPRFIPLDGHWHLEKTKTYVNGAPGEIRTHDLRLRRATLYPAELRAHVMT